MKTVFRRVFPILLHTILPEKIVLFLVNKTHDLLTLPLIVVVDSRLFERVKFGSGVDVR